MYMYMHSVHVYSEFSTRTIKYIEHYLERKEEGKKEKERKLQHMHILPLYTYSVHVRVHLKLNLVHVQANTCASLEEAHVLNRYLLSACNGEVHVHVHVAHCLTLTQMPCSV